MLLVFAIALGACKARPATAPEPLRLYSRADAPNLPTDPNGFLLNPRWLGGRSLPPDMDDECRFRVRVGHLERRTLHTTKPQCLSEDERLLVSLDEAPSSLGLGAVCVTGSKTGRIAGHVNWFPVTVTGRIVWNAYSADPGDRDINMDLIPPGPSAVTTGNDTFPAYKGRRGYHTESYLDETLARIPRDLGGFWTALNRVYQSKPSAQDLVDHRLAIVTGLYGIDGVHGNHAELHPVFAMSILVDTARANGELREEWAVMIRNTGSEGNCAEGTHPLLTESRDGLVQDFTIDFGPVIGDPPVVSLSQEWTSDKRYTPRTEVRPHPKTGKPHLYLTLTHPRPRPGGPDFAYFGTLHVQWPRANAGTWEADRFAGLMPESNEPLKLRRGTDGVIAQTFAPSNAPPHGVRVYKAESWPVPNMAFVADCKGLHKREAFCYGESRWLLGATHWRSGMFPQLSWYFFPHSKYYEEGALADAKNFFFTLGHRLDLRAERWVPNADETGPTRRCWNNPLYKATHARCGVGLRWSPMLSPSTVRLSDTFSIMPYTAANIGLSFIPNEGNDDLHGSYGWGPGLQFRFGRHDIMLETQRVARWDWDYENRWVWTLLWITPSGRRP